MTELPDFTGYEPVELSQVRKGDVVAAVLDGTIAHGKATYARKDSIDLDSGFNTTAQGNYQFFRAPKRLPRGDCAVIEYKDADGFEHRAISMENEWFVFDFVTNQWYFSDPQPVDLRAVTGKDFTTIFEGVRK